MTIFSRANFMSLISGVNANEASDNGVGESNMK